MPQPQASRRCCSPSALSPDWSRILPQRKLGTCLDRKSTRLNSSHLVISYAVFCLKKKKENNSITHLKEHSQNQRVGRLHDLVIDGCETGQASHRDDLERLIARSLQLEHCARHTP